MYSDGPPPFRPKQSSHAGVIGLIIVITAAIGLYLWSERMSAPRLSKTRPVAAPERPRIVSPLPSPSTNPRPAAPTQAVRPPAPDMQQSTPARQTLYLCKSYAGAIFWTSGTCSSQRATIDRIAIVPGHLSFPEQVAIASGEARAAAALYEAPPPAGAGGFGTPAPQRADGAECAALIERIRSLDAMARQPQSAYTQDWLRAERMQVMSRRHALNC